MTAKVIWYSMNRLSGMFRASAETDSSVMPLRNTRSSVPMNAPSPVNVRL